MAESTSVQTNPNPIMNGGILAGESVETNKTEVKTTFSVDNDKEVEDNGLNRSNGRIVGKISTTGIIFPQGGHDDEKDELPLSGNAINPAGSNEQESITIEKFPLKDDSFPDENHRINGTESFDSLGNGNGESNEGYISKKNRMGYSSDSSTSSSGSNASAGGGAGVHLKLSSRKKRKRKHKESPAITFFEQGDEEGEESEKERKSRLLMPSDLSIDGAIEEVKARKTGMMGEGILDSEESSYHNQGDTSTVDDGDKRSGNFVAANDFNNFSDGKNDKSCDANSYNDCLHSSIHTNAVPPERAMSPMPRREDASSCPSPPPDMHADVNGNNSGYVGISRPSLVGMQVHSPVKRNDHHHSQQLHQHQQQQPLEQHHQIRTMFSQQHHEKQLYDSTSTSIANESFPADLNRNVSTKSRNTLGKSIDSSDDNEESPAHTPDTLANNNQANTSNNRRDKSNLAKNAVANSMESSIPSPDSTTSTTATSASHSSNETSPSLPSQPPGWRVKLYRLNIDGTWDDCGTGRIQFYYARNVGNGGVEAQANHYHHFHQLSGQQFHQKQTNQQQQRQQQQHQQHQQRASINTGAAQTTSSRCSSGGHQLEESSSASNKQGAQHHRQHNHNPNLPPPPQFIVPPTVFRELGEPMLCMRAEIPPHHSGGNQTNEKKEDLHNDSGHISSSKNESKVLLRTRVLLHEAYQCQGGNIITWCEPLHPGAQGAGRQQESNDHGNSSHQEEDNLNGSTSHHLQHQHHHHHGGNSTGGHSSASSPQGVDLALSFQDNAGCKDIWQHILDVQVRAAELARAWSGGAPGDAAMRGDRPDTASSDNAIVGSHISTNNNRVGLSSSYVADESHPHNERESAHVNLHPHVQQKGHDHDAVEDRQFSLVTGGVPLGHTRPQLWTNHAVSGASTHVVGHSLQSHNHSANTLQPHTVHLTQTQSHHSRNGGSGQNHYHRSSSGSGFKNHDEEGEAQFNDAIDDLNAVSMAATAAASYGVGAGARGDSIGGESEGGPNGPEEVGAILSPSPSPSMSNSSGVQHHGFNNDVGFNIGVSPSQLPNPPKLNELDRIGDILTNAQIQQREDFAMFLSQSDCAYIKSLMQFFPEIEESNDFGRLATLAVCVKSTLLLNDPEIIEYITTDEVMFEKVCAVLEYDPELRGKANHRWFFREQAKFRTVVKMEDEELVSCIHRLFRVTYLRDTVLRPTMDESSLSTLGSLAQFTQSDIVKGVMRVPLSSGKMRDGHVARSQTHMISKPNESEDTESYYFKILRVLATEIKAILKLKWDEDCLSNSSVAAMTTTPPHKLAGEDERTNTDTSAPNSPRCPSPTPSDQRKYSRVTILPSVKSEASDALQQPSSMWQQHIAPQDPSLRSRYIRRQGCLSFLKELFNMARLSLQQNEKDEFIATAASMSLAILEGPITDSSSLPGYSDDERSLSNEKASGLLEGSEDFCSTKDDIDAQNSLQNKLQTKSSTFEPPQTTCDMNLLSLLGAVLSDPNADKKERGASLEILSIIAMHDPSIFRRHCLDSIRAENTDIDDDTFTFLQPNPNENRQVVFICPPDDLFLSLIFVMTTETDAGLLLQTSEIIRIVLDTESIGEQGLGGGISSFDCGNDLKTAGEVTNGQNKSQHFLNHCPERDTSEQDSFLSIFYDRYMQWLVLPFQYKVLAPKIAVPLRVIGRKNMSWKDMMRMRQDLKYRINSCDDSLRSIPPCSIRASFTLEIMSFCVRAHVNRMKFFVLRTRLLSSILKVLCQTTPSSIFSGERCLKLSCLKFLRAVLSVKDEFYHRHIIQYNLFAPVFDVFRSNHRGDNLLSSAILEICDFIRAENLKSLLEHIVTKHLTTVSDHPPAIKDEIHPNDSSSLEELANPYGDTLTQLRKKYEENKYSAGGVRGDSKAGAHLNDDTAEVNNAKARSSNKKALEDQRKFRESDEDDSYFNTDDTDGGNFPTTSIQVTLGDRVSSLENTEVSTNNHAEN
ncbi:hypothetical protein ACHAXS_013784 [Conticribra weissflogii]